METNNNKEQNKERIIRILGGIEDDKKIRLILCFIETLTE